MLLLLLLFPVVQILLIVGLLMHIKVHMIHYVLLVPITTTRTTTRKAAGQVLQIRLSAIVESCTKGCTDDNSLHKQSNAIYTS